MGVKKYAMNYREEQEKLLKELSYFINKGNARTILDVFVHEMDPPEMKNDIHYGAHVSAVLGILWNIVQSYSGNVPQKKRMLNLYSRMEDIICVKEDDYEA